MKLLKTAAAMAVGVALLTGCNDETNYYHPVDPAPKVTDVKIGVYNLSFDRNTYEDLVAELKLTPAEQQVLMDKWFDGTLTSNEKTIAEKVIQIKNVAAIIQTERPAVLLMAEFNNDGTGEDLDAIQAFRLNYLAVPQNALGSTSDEVKLLEPIQFPYVENFATNTGLLSDHDLNRDGKVALPDDAWGFGFYHGQYAFSLISQYPIDTDNIRTFQHFKWKDMPGEKNPIITNCDDERYPIPEGMACGDEWYSEAAWAEKPMSSKNHVDAPIIIPTAEGDKVIHLLLSHPTPPIFDTLTENNKLLNRAEVKFWDDYISGNGSYIYDDEGTKGGIKSDSSFVILGDLNADPERGDGYLDTIKDLMYSDQVNQLATHGVYAPRSLGGPECLSTGECRESNWGTKYPGVITSTSGLRLDHVIPSSDLNVTESGVFWPATFEEGRLMMNDVRVGNWGGGGKSVSSDHRLVWVNIEL
ncbi:endonuclease/exonuclease/phosphatase family protein [Shewanella aestuarii]|uniref:Endonuclease/exonuclease/phosphatase family protein n=1 Tax=Shewanella aestuarii TaxID=1028752 RepID=A0A6G9QJK5_9GAMM|nr:endonuclease/exonuclease/phosphatase family protein [Shewanella aestuarii]QIR14059.1 endonuclease/exonuclease/phosphatase family protein [Shewanella aestuarii]